MLDWLSDAAILLMPLLAGGAVFCMFAAFCVRRTERENYASAYRVMRVAAVSLLIAFILLWLLWRGFIPRPSVIHGGDIEY